MVRVISQETFDAVVKENVEDLEMSQDEAVKEAKEQFKAQVRKKYLLMDTYIYYFLILQTVQ